MDQGLLKTYFLFHASCDRNASSVFVPECANVVFPKQNKLHHFNTRIFRFDATIDSDFLGHTSPSRHEARSTPTSVNKPRRGHDSDRPSRVPSTSAQRVLPPLALTHFVHASINLQTAVTIALCRPSSRYSSPGIHLMAV